MKKKPAKKPAARVLVAVDPDTLQSIRKRARLADRSFVGEVRRLLRFALANIKESA